MRSAWLILGFTAAMALWLVPSMFAHLQSFDGIYSQPVWLVAADGTPLSACAYWPAGADGPLPGVVVAHGFTESLEMVQHYSLAFARAGFYVVSLNMRGHADSGGHAESADAGSTHPRYLDADISAVIDYMQAHPELVDFYPNENVSAAGQLFRPGIGVVGHSMGGAAAVEAGRIDRRIVAVVGVAAAHRGEGVNESYPANLLLAVGMGDRVVPPSASFALLRNATGNASAIAGDLYSDFSMGTARMMTLSAGVGHIEEIWDPTIISEAVAWVEDSMGLSTTTYNPAPLKTSIICLCLSLVGMMLMLAYAPIASVRTVGIILEVPREETFHPRLQYRWPRAGGYIALGVLGSFLGVLIAPVFFFPRP